MKMQVKAIAAAIAFAVAGSANAAIDQGNGNSGEMFFSVYDATAQLSYTRDLGIDVLTYRDNPNGIDVAADQNLTDFIANAQGPLVWNMGGMSAVAISSIAAIDQRGFISTTTDPLSGISSSPDGITQAMGAGQPYVQGVNALDGASNTDFGLNLSTTNIPSGNDGYYGGVNWGSNWGGTTAFNTEAALGSTMSLMFDGTTYVAGTGIATHVLDLGKITLQADGHLVSAVPAPAAVWLFSLGMLGLVGIARRRKSA